MNFPGGATGLDSVLKAYKTYNKKQKDSYERFDHPDKTQHTELSPYDTFYSKLRSCNPLEAEYNNYVSLFESGGTIELIRRLFALV